MRRRLLGAIFVIASVGGAASAAPPTPLPFQKRGFDARRNGDYRGCAAIFAAAARERTYDADAPLNAARCFSLLGRTDDAERYLRLAFDRGYHDCQRLQRTKELAGFAGTFARRCAANDEVSLRYVNAALLFAFEDDQAERAALPSKPPFDFSKIMRHDAARRHLVEVMLARGLVRSADDYYHAAMILQHGLDAGAYVDARRFARHAVELRPWFAEARWRVPSLLERMEFIAGLNDESP